METKAISLKEYKHCADLIRIRPRTKIEISNSRYDENYESRTLMIEFRCEVG